MEVIGTVGGTPTSQEVITARVLFIGGWGRSGSTLLDRMLGQLDETVSVGEMRDIWQRGVIENRLCGCGEPFRDCPFWSAVGKRAFGGWDRLDIDRIASLRARVDRPWFIPFLAAPMLLPARLRADLREYTEAVATLYRAIDHVSEGCRIIDSSKIPSYSMILRLAGVEQRVLHLVRDSRGVIHSWRKAVERPDATQDPDQMLQYGVVSGSLRYLFYNGLTHVLPALGLPYRRLRYEDLVAEPLTALEAVGGFVELGLPESVVSDLEARSVTFAPSHTVDGNPMRLTLGATAIREDDAWRRELSPTVARVVGLLTAPLLWAYGYRPLRTRTPLRRGAA